MLLDLIRRKQHVLSKESEALMAQMSEIAGAPKQIFSMINNADIKFGRIHDEDGDEIEVTHGNYISLMESSDRAVRKAAYENLYAAYAAQKIRWRPTIITTQRKTVSFPKSELSFRSGGRTGR